MKHSRTLYDARSPHLNEYQPQYPAITAVQQHLASNSQTSEYQDYFSDALGLTQDLDPLQQFLGSNVEPYDAQANTSNRYDFASSSTDAQRNVLQEQQSPPQHGQGVRRGVAHYAESPGLIGTGHKARSAAHHLRGAAASPYNARGRSVPATSQRSVFIPMLIPPAATAESTEARPTPYSSYRGLFGDSDAARDHRHMSTRFGRQPYIFPEDDPTIGEVERDRNMHVGRIYDAMVCGDRAQDNPGSIAMKRWVNGAHYKSDLVEAFAHKVFDCLLVQVQEGFRGWHHNDYVDDDRKGEKEDREADCANRLENIIDALEREKTVCEDVVTSASQIRMFVNAPIAYAQRKFQNRQGNSKRGRIKDTPDSNPRPTQRRRTGGRQLNRATDTPDRPVLRDTTPQFQTAASGLPYYASASSRQLLSSPTPSYLTPRQPLPRPAMSMPHVSAGYRQATAATSPITTRPCIPPTTTSLAAMSPPKAPDPRPHNAHATMMPPAQMLPAHMSPVSCTPSSQPYTYHSAPPSPNDTKYPSASSPADWPTADTLATSACTPVDPLLTAADLLFTPDTWSDEAPACATDGPNGLKQLHVSLADIERAPLATAAFGGEDPVHVFEPAWNEIPGVQRFSFDAGTGELY